MFTKSMSVITLTPTTIQVHRVTPGRPQRIAAGPEVPWTTETLPTILQKIKSMAGPAISLLVSDEFTYTTSFPVPSDQPHDMRNAVKTLAQEIIPEDLDDVVWDFKEISTTPPTIQCVAASKTFSHTILPLFSKSGFHLERAEPISQALARLVHTSPTPLLLVHPGPTTLLVAVKGELVIAAQTITHPLTPADVTQFLSFIQQTTQLSLSIILFSKKLSAQGLQQFASPNYHIEIKELSPVAGISYKTDVKGKDAVILNLVPLPPSTHPISQNTKVDNRKEQETIPAAQSHQVHPLIAILLILLIPTLAVGGTAWIIFRKPVPKISNTASHPPTPTEQTASPSSTLAPTTVNIADYPIKILNGSGREGEATQLAGTLKTKGFTVTATGNAPVYDFDQTTIQATSRVPKEVIDRLDSALRTVYTVDIGDPLEPTGDNEGIDILITIGKT